MKKTNGVALKKYIYENEMVEFLLESIGCDSIKYHAAKNYWTCSNNDGDNPNAIIVKNNPYLGVKNFTRSKGYDENSDIISLVKNSLDITFPKACEYIKKALDISNSSFSSKDIGNKEYSESRKNNVEKTKEVEQQSELDERILDRFVPLLFIGWLREGVTKRSKEKFGICYSYEQSRVIIPIRHWNTGKLLATSARTTVEGYKDFGIAKYIVTPNYKKHLNIYGLYEHKKDILEKRYLVIHEAEKSVLKRDSLLDFTGVAIQGKSISDEQVEIILSLDIDEVILSMDEDVSIDELRFLANKFYGKRKVSYIYDSWGMLEPKQSPADLRMKDYQFLFDNRIEFDSKEHDLYIKSMRIS